MLKARSACVADATTSVAVAELMPNDWFAPFALAVSVITVPAGVPPRTPNTTVKAPLVPTATLGLVHGLTGNPVQVHPVGGRTETKFVLAGVASVKVAIVTAEVPVLVTT